jgi:hypothetical protein
MEVTFPELHSKVIKLANDTNHPGPKLKSKILCQFLAPDESDPLNIRFNKRSYARYSKLGPSSILRHKFN